MEIKFELLQKIINTIDLGIVFVDTDNKIVIFNHTAGDMLNVDPEERIGTSLLLCHPKESEQRVLQVIDFFRKNPQHRTKGEIFNVQGRYLQQTFYSIPDEKGNYMGVMMVFKDAKEMVSLLKQSGEFEEPRVVGVDEKRPRRPDNPRVPKN